MRHAAAIPLGLAVEERLQDLALGQAAENADDRARSNARSSPAKSSTASSAVRLPALISARRDFDVGLPLLRALRGSETGIGVHRRRTGRRARGGRHDRLNLLGLLSRKLCDALHEVLHQGCVGRRMLQERGKARFRETRALIAAHGAKNGLVALVDQGVGQAFGEGRALGDGHPAVRGQARQKRDEVVVGEGGREAQHFPRDGNARVGCEALGQGRRQQSFRRDALGVAGAFCPRACVRARRLRCR